MTNAFKSIFYKDSETGKEPFVDWLEGLKDRAAQARILVRIARSEEGNFGDHKSVGSGIYELRISFGPGYRVYYALDGQKMILLLLGGDKSTQSKDIAKAQKFWTAYKKEKKNG